MQGHGCTYYGATTAVQTVSLSVCRSISKGKKKKIQFIFFCSPNLYPFYVQHVITYIPPSGFTLSVVIGYDDDFALPDNVGEVVHRVLKTKVQKF